MKKIIAILLTVLLVLSLAACSKNGDTKKEEKTKTEETKAAAIQATQAPTTVESGGWTDAASPVITSEIKEMVDKANKVLTGAQYTPVAYLASQVVSGTNHLILCKSTATVPDASSEYVLVTFYQDLQGNVEVTDTKSCGDTAPEAADPDNPESGAWSETTTPEMTTEATKAFQKATASQTGKSYDAKALLATQVVGGFNYKILCKVTSSVSPEYVIITVYADTEDGAEIVQTFEFTALVGASAVEESKNTASESSGDDAVVEGDEEVADDGGEVAAAEEEDGEEVADDGADDEADDGDYDEADDGEEVVDEGNEEAVNEEE